MSAPVTPYTRFLGDVDALAAIRNSLDRFRTLLDGWPPDRFERSYEPGKWSARQILTHLAQTEMALGVRIRYALATPGYVAQAWDQDPWVARESRLGGADARAVLLALARMNLLLFESLSAAERAIPLSHPEYGTITVDWIIHQLAGHHINHLLQLERIGR
jgi:hypothetical protein